MRLRVRPLQSVYVPIAAPGLLYRASGGHLGTRRAPRPGRNAPATPDSRMGFIQEYFLIIASVEQLRRASCAGCQLFNCRDVASVRAGPACAAHPLVSRLHTQPPETALIGIDIPLIQSVDNWLIEQWGRVGEPPNWTVLGTRSGSGATVFAEERARLFACAAPLYGDGG